MSDDKIIKKLLKNVTLTAFYSRIFILVLQFIFNVIIPDHESDGFITPAISIPKTTADEVVSWFFGGFLRWDAQYFIHISIYGYVYENSLAFFPGFPITVRIVARLFEIVCQFLNVFSLCLISSVVINIIGFVLAARILFFLTYKELQDEQLAYVASMFFCINPASIFFSAPYSETLFSICTFYVMYNNNLLSSCAFVALSALIRSNGIVNVGFPVYLLMSKFLGETKNCFTFLTFFFKLVIVLITSSSTFIFYQFYSYFQFCTSFRSNTDVDIIKVASLKSYILSGIGHSNMCNSFVPYFYIQSNYWDVGFLHYFQFKQIPNFALAFPIICFSGGQIINYFICNHHLFRTFGLLTSSKSKPDEKIFVYVVHLFVLLIICLFFVHIQVSTRLLCSSSPAIYWFCAKLTPLNKKYRFRLRYLLQQSNILHIIFAYCIIYCVIGTALFCNFFPWT